MEARASFETALCGVFSNYGGGGGGLAGYETASQLFFS